MRKQRNMNRESRTQQAIPAPKMKKACEETFARTCMSWETQDKRQELAPSRSENEKRQETLKTPAP